MKNALVVLNSKAGNYDEATRQEIERSFADHGWQYRVHDLGDQGSLHDAVQSALAQG